MRTSVWERSALKMLKRNPGRPGVKGAAHGLLSKTMRAVCEEEVEELEQERGCVAICPIAPGTDARPRVPYDFSMGSLEQLSAVTSFFTVGSVKRARLLPSSCVPPVDPAKVANLETCCLSGEALALRLWIVPRCGDRITGGSRAS